MESVVLPLLVFLVAGSEGRLSSGDSQGLGGYNYPVPSSTVASPSASSVAPGEIGGIIGNPYNNPSPYEEETKANNGFSSQGNLRKSFSYEPLKADRGKVRYEALKSNINEQPNTYYNKESEKPQNKTLYPERRNMTVYHNQNNEQDVDENASVKSISGPNVDGQQPYRHWSTESNVIREEHPDGLYPSYPYVTPTRPRQHYSRGNLKRVFDLSTTESSEGRKLPKQLFTTNIDTNQHAIIPATTYRPLTTDDHAYSFSFSSKNHSRHETGDTKGNFRGSIKFVNTYGGSKQIDYEGNPDIGIVTTERAPVVNIPGRSGQRYLPPSTSWPLSTGRNGLTYSFTSSSTPHGYSPNPVSSTLPTNPYSPNIDSSTPQPNVFRSTQLPVGYSANSFINTPSPLGYSSNTFSTTPASEFPNRRGKTVYQPPQYYLQPMQTYVTSGMGDPYMYYTETPQYVMLPPNYGSYMFSYNTGDSQRREIRDKQGNVQGMYSYDDPDGERKHVTYEANAEKGFVARGRHLPVQPEDLTGSQGTYQQTTLSPGTEPSSSGGTYFFSYNAGEHMRQERKDENGNIHGMYSYLTGDGKRKTVNYRASPSEGFVASGDDIPNNHDGSYSVKYKAGEQHSYPNEATIGNEYQPQISIR